MTLLIASIRPRDIVVTADGRSTTWTNGKVTAVFDTLQKIFPVPDHPLFIAHHGQNQLNGKPVSELILAFIKPLNAGNLTIGEAADDLRMVMYGKVRDELSRLDPKMNGCGFWVGGFSVHEKSPALVELFWKWTGEALVLEERHWGPTAIVTGGDGKTQIGNVSWHDIDNKTVDEVREYHRALMDKAMRPRAEPNVVGGHVHELLVSRDEWKWTLPPANSSR